MNKIVVYTREDCTACYHTKRWLAAHDVSYTEVILNDADAKLLADKGYTTLPVVVCPDGTAWQGFNIDALRTWTKLATYVTGAPTGQSVQPNEEGE